MSNEAVIVDVVRTPSGRGKPGGALSGVHPADLLAGVLGELVSRNGLDPALVDDVIGGCVSQAGEQGFNITRTALLAAGFPDSVPAVTIDRQCGSSQQAATFAAQGVIAGSYDIVIACGVESMSRAPLGSSLGGKDPYGELLAAYLRRAASAFASAQSAQGAAEVVIEACLTDTPHFRWQTSPAAAAFAGLSLADLDGSRVLDQTTTWLA